MLLATSLATIARADEIDNLREAIEAAKRSKLCPPPAEYPILKFESYCKSLCDIGHTCHGTIDSDPCENGDHAGCHKFAAETDQCLRDMNDKNKTILEYNSIVSKCSGKASQPGAPSKDNSRIQPGPERSEPSGAALAKAVQDAKQRAEVARAKAREANSTAVGAGNLDETEKNKLKAEAARLAPWCQSLVSTCQRWTASLQNADQATTQQCTAYCQILQIEDCNGASSTVQGSARMCAEQAQRSRRQAVDYRKRREEEVRKKEEDEAAGYATEMARQNGRGTISPEASFNDNEPYQQSSPGYSNSAPSARYNNSPSTAQRAAPVQRPAPQPYVPPPQPRFVPPSRPSCSQTSGHTCAVQ
jgi:hypothetical protein